MNYFVTAIDTDSGKTLVSAILTEALQADYWKPIQAGTPTDRDTVKSLVSDHIILHPEAFFLTSPMSPHAAAKIDQVKINPDDIKLPDTANSLVIEGAGGLMVPINDKEFIIDLIPQFNAEVILVCNIYLGSINHSILSLLALQQKGYKLKGIIFNGPSNYETEQVILNYAGAPCLLHIEKEQEITSDIIQQYAAKLRANWISLD